MRAVTISALAAIGIFSIVARAIFGKLLHAVAHEIPGIKLPERELRFVASFVSIGFGTLVICLAILMAFNVIFPW